MILLSHIHRGHGVSQGNLNEEMRISSQFLKNDTKNYGEYPAASGTPPMLCYTEAGPGMLCYALLNAI